MGSDTAPGARLIRDRNFRLYLAARGFAVLAMQIQSVAVGWQIYDITSDPLALGYVGLALFAPVFALTLPAGDVADRFERRRVAAASYAAQGLASALLVVLALSGTREAGLFYAVLALLGAARAFAGPAQQSLLPLIVAQQQLASAIGWSSAAFKIALILGPAVGGGLLILGPQIAYAAAAVSFAIVATCVSFIATSAGHPHRASAGSALRRLIAGILYVQRQRVILGAISLDLFAVLLGGATALLPIYARDILGVGPEGLGLLRSAPGVGALLVGLALALRPLDRRVGRAMLLAVVVFGAATIVFGLSTNFLLSLAALAVMGGSDMVSVFVRQTTIQLATPDDMRGRVSSVNALFIGASNELGDFESGITAAWFGTVPAVVGGGVGTILVVALWSRLFPELRRLDRFADVVPRADRAAADLSSAATRSTRG